MKRTAPTVTIKKPRLKKLHEAIRVGKGYQTHKQFKF